MIDLIVCTGGNRKYWEVVSSAGLKNGAQLPDTVYGELFFADQNYHRPNRQAYMTALEKHRPNVATVLDWERMEQFEEVLEWANQAAQMVKDVVVIIPKVLGGVDLVPEYVGVKPVRLGYSVETSHGSTPVPIESFIGWKHGVHLLGGNPLRQLELARTPGLDVRSVDCNQIMLKANRWTQFLDFKAYQHGMFSDGVITTRWKQLKHIGLGGMKEAPSEALRRSCASLLYCWNYQGA